MSSLPRRVLMTADTVGGVWTYAVELAASLARHDISVVLATMGAPLSPSQWKDVRALTSVDVRESTFRLEWMNNPWDDVARAGEWLLQLERETRPDLIHLNGYAHGVLPFHAPVLVVGHSCVLSWFQAVKGHAAPEEWEHYRAKVSAGLRAADHVVAPSNAMLDALRVHYGIETGSVISNGRDPTRYTASTKEPFVLAAGRLWDEAKNISALGRASRHVSWPIIVAGDATSPDGATVGLDGVRALGRLAPSELVEWFAKASIYAHPARYEPFGLSVLEAALSGCALVLGDIASLREIWGEAAIYVPPDAPEELGHTIASLVADPTRRAHLAHLAQQRARAFTPERTAQAYVAVYEQLLGSRQKAGGVNRCAL